MELSKELKEKVENAASAEEAKKILEEAGIKLLTVSAPKDADGRCRFEP